MKTDIRKTYYDLYDLLGNIIFERVECRQLATFLGVKSTYIAQCSQMGTMIQGKYKIVKSVEDDTFPAEWEAITTKILKYYGKEKY